MTEASASRKRALLFLRNGLAFAAMVALYGAALALVNQTLVRFDIQGIHRLTVVFTADALCGVLGYFLFAGDGRLRSWLVFFSAIAFGALMVLLHDPQKTFHPLLTSLPFAAVAALAANATGLYVEKKQKQNVSD